MKLRHIGYAAIALSATLIITSCEDINNFNPDIPSTDEWQVNKNEQIFPERIELEIHEGHSHTNPKERGDVFWTDADGGFHANPDTRELEFPYKTVQEITLVRRGNEYVPDAQSDSVFRVVGSSRIGANYTALIVRLYDKEGKRMDLAMKTPEMRDRVQVFMRPKLVRPLYPGVKELPNDPDPRRLFYFWYMDREKDSPKEAPQKLQTPVGFRGVFQCAIPYTRLDVEVAVTILPEGETKGTPAPSDRMPEKAAKHVALRLNVPIRVFTLQRLDTPIDPNLSWDDYDKVEEAEYTRYFEDLAREYPKYTPKQIEQLEEEADTLPLEGENFWL